LRSEPGWNLWHDRFESPARVMLTTKVLNDLFDEVATQIR
jgi:hypothetical protein